jgi:phosphate transport system substrate-binding protein
MRHRYLFAASFAACALLAGGTPAPAQPNAAPGAKTIQVDGSSTVEPVTSAVAAEFSKAHPDVRLSVAVSGTSGGFRRFVVGETDMSNASRAIKAAEIKTAGENGVGYVESLVAFDGLTVAVDRETKIFKSGRPCMTVGELQLLWGREAEGTVKRWSQLGSRFADAAVTLSGAASTSGTFDFFTDAVNKKEGDTRSDYFGTEEDQLLAEQTGQDPNALTYFGYAFYLHNQDRVQPVAIDSRATTIDAPKAVLDQVNAKRAANGKEPLANGGGACQGVGPDVDTIGSFAYQPLTRPLFVYTNLKSAERPVMAEFLESYLAEERIGSREFMLDVGYIPITRRLREAARSCWAKRVPGTAFDGEFGGLSAQDIATKYASHCKL